MRRRLKTLHSSRYPHSLIKALFAIMLISILSSCDLGLGGSSNSSTNQSSNCSSSKTLVRGRIFDRNGVLLAYSKLSSNGQGYQRYYSEPSLAGLIGYYIGPQYASTGLEHQYDDYLSGRKATPQGCPTAGEDIYLTIDVRIQRIVDHYFTADTTQPDSLNVFPTDRGSVIVADPHTGETLAMLSRPGFDPNRIAAGDVNYLHQLQNDPEQPLLFRPLEARYVPGSTYKVVTLMAALDSGSSQLNSPFDQQQAVGPVTIGNETFGPIGNNIQTYTRNYPVSLDYGFAHSDNVIFAEVGAKVGVNTWLDYNHRFYVGQQIPFDLPVATSSVTPQGSQSLSIAQLAENSFGQGIDNVTPFQMSLFDDAIANNGHLMRPALVMKIVGSNQTTIQSLQQQELSSPISQQTASQVRDAMFGVVQCGTGRFGAPEPELYLSPWNIIAKTGTGQLSQNSTGSQAIPAESWLITQAPYQNPVLTITAMKENGGDGGPVNGPMVKDIYNDIFTNIMKIPTPPTPDPNYCATTGLLQA